MGELGRFAALEDATGGGYLAPTDSLATNRTQREFAEDCVHFAAQLLKDNQPSSAAKNVVRRGFQEIERTTATGSFTSDERALIDRYTDELDTKIDWVAAKSPSQRLMYRTPPFVRNWIILIGLASVTVMTALAFFR